MHLLKSIILLILSITIISCGSSKDETSSTVRTTNVITEVVQRETVRETSVLPGVVEAWEIVPVAIETLGPIDKIYVEEGDTIKAGKIILTLNTDALRANLESSRIQLESAKTDFHRSENLFAKEAISKKSYEDASNAYQIAIASYRVATEQQSKSTLKSPVTGVIDTIYPKEGEYINTGYLVTNIVVLDKLKIYVDVSEKDIPFIKTGQKVNIFVTNNLTNKKEIIKGQINYVSVIADPQSLTYKVRIDLNKNSVIRPGRIIRAEIPKYNIDNAIAIELYSVISNPAGHHVFVNEGGIAKKRAVVLGPMVGDKVVITSGLTSGDHLIISGQQFLSDNSLVSVNTKENNASVTNTDNKSR